MINANLSQKQMLLERKSQIQLQFNQAILYALRKSTSYNTLIQLTKMRQEHNSKRGRPLSQKQPLHQRIKLTTLLVSNQKMSTFNARHKRQFKAVAVKPIIIQTTSNVKMQKSQDYSQLTQQIEIKQQYNLEHGLRVLQILILM